MDNRGFVDRCDVKAMLLERLGCECDDSIRAKS